MNRLFLNLKIAWRSLCNFRLRTLLAIFGIFLGTFSLIIVLNLSRSLSKKTEIEIENMGKNLLIVRSGIVRRFATGIRLLSEATNLTRADSEAILNGSSFVNAISPLGSRYFPVRYEGITLNSVLVTGVMPNYTEIRNFHVKKGIFVSEEDNKNLKKAAVIGSRIAEKLFGDRDPLGKHILIFRVPCEVIGVMEEKGVDLSGLDQDYQIFVPLNTFLRRFINKEYLTGIYVQVIDESVTFQAKKEIEDIIRIRHGIKEGKKDDFTVIDMKDLVTVRAQAMETINLLGTVSAVISFLIGGIGILSIMILIVNERRLEIGIRRAVGSRKRDILFQFLMESSFIALSGGAIGVIGGFTGTALILKAFKLPLTISLAGPFISFLISVIIGILSGLYPAKKATTIQPIDIIRS